MKLQMKHVIRFNPEAKDPHWVEIKRPEIEDPGDWYPIGVWKSKEECELNLIVKGLKLGKLVKVKPFETLDSGEFHIWKNCVEYEVTEL